MAQAKGAFLVVRRDDGYGDVTPLQSGQRYVIGRANTCRLVVKDELARREHAEIFFAEGRWRLRDLKSLNGTRVNNMKVEEDWTLNSGDEVSVGRSRYVYVDRIEELPNVPLQGASTGAMSIKKRMSNSRFLTPYPEDVPEDATQPADSSRRNISHDLTLLYRLGLEMGSVASYRDLCQVVLDGLLQAASAEVGAILTVTEGRELDVTAVRPKDHEGKAYAPASEFVTNEVLSSKEAVLAENVARNRYLSQRDSLTNLGATSLICAPVIHNAKVLALIHLYCTDPHRSLSSDDLEFTVAVAKHMGIVVAQMQRQDSLSQENRELRDQLRVESELVGSSPQIRSVLDQISRVAPTNATVLVRGESGVGKELVARALHFSSPRRERPFVCLNCAAITETLLESELFGHERGAFTGATEKKIGKFEAAHQGTIFLDEIGEMAVNTQAKLLRILEGHPFERVGGGTPIRVDVRVVAATNQPLEKNIQEGRFRRDLFYRLQVVEIVVPPLREHKADVQTLADHFLRRFIRETGRKIRGFSPAAYEKMQAYDWPGNVRELRNVVERAVALGRGNVIEASDIWLSSLEIPNAAAEGYTPISIEEMERKHIIRTLEHTEWNKSQAAHILQIERSTLDRKIKAYEIKRDEG